MRCDGRKVSQDEPIYFLIPYFLTHRYDAMNMITVDIPEEPLRSYMNQKRKEGQPVNHMALLITASVCSVGLDMIILPGDTSAAVISGIIADEAAIGMVNQKTTAVRVIPAVGYSVGDELNFGGLLGGGPVMPVRSLSPAVFVDRGGYIPAPMQSLKN